MAKAMAWDSDTPFDDAQCEKNLKRLRRKESIALEGLSSISQQW